MNPKEMEKLQAEYYELLAQKEALKEIVPARMFNGLTNLGAFMAQCSPKNTRMPGFKQAIGILPKDSIVRKNVSSYRFRDDKQILYKYVSKNRAPDLTEHNLLYCDTIENCRKGTWGDPTETVFFDMADIILAENKEAYELLNGILKAKGLPKYDQKEIFDNTLDAIGKKRICCMSKSPFIKEMWEWKGNDEALCFPIDVRGLAFYEIEYSDAKIDPQPYVDMMINMIRDATEGKASRYRVQNLYNELSALSYLSLCKKKTKRDDGLRWDVQQECRMFPEKFYSLGDKKDCYINLEKRVGKAITYSDYLDQLEKDLK
jgi:hypothetical protein